MLSNQRISQATWQSNLPATPLAGLPMTLTAHATPHEKGAWVTLVSSATYDSFGFWIVVAGSSTNATRTDMMLDVAIGPNQENIIVPEWLCGWRGNIAASPMGLYFPIFIPKGSQVSARIQALITIDAVTCLFMLNGGLSGQSGPIFRGCDALGTVPASSIGTSHTPGNTGAESTAADIGSPTTKHYGAISLMVQGTMSNTNMTAIGYHWELVIGGQTICEWYTRCDGTEATLGPFPPTPFYTSIPSGTQLQIRAEASGTAQAQDVAFYGYY